jgi:isopropylmalate/homocitrate/citramalate synthase
LSASDQAPSRSNLSPLNQPLRSPDGNRVKVSLRELTLRQLFHSDGDLTLVEKLYWLTCLDDAGVRRTSVRVAVEPDAAEMVARARDAGLGIQIELHGAGWIKENWQRVIATARSAGAAWVYCSARGSDWALEAMGKSAIAMRREMIESCVGCIGLAKDAGLKVSLGVAYATQADPAYLEELAVSVESAGLDRIHLNDSIGGASPVAMHAMVSNVRRSVAIPIEIHCHNDCGLALANTIACVEAGAQLVDVCVNGADPDRGGLASLAEVVVALELLYDVDTGVRLSALTGLSRTHEALTGWPTPANMPIVGPRAFSAHLAKGKHASYAPGEIRGAERDQFYAAPEHDEPFAPEAVGNRHVILLGKYSGANEVEQRLSDLGLKGTDDQVQAVVKMVQDRGRAYKRVVSDDEVRFFMAVASHRSPN